MPIHSALYSRCLLYTSWEGVEAFAESFADGWTFSVRAAAGEEKRLYLFSVRRDGQMCIRDSSFNCVPYIWSIR